ncbi:hypothetical protein [Pseudonocardia xishanensis]
MREFARDFEVRHGASLELTYVAEMSAGIVDMASVAVWGVDLGATPLTIR